MKMFMVLVIIALPISIYGSFPTNTTVSFKLIPDFPGSTSNRVKLIVFDEQRNQEITHTTPFSQQVTTPTIKDGVIKWRLVGAQGTILRHYFAVYDPKCGCWELFDTNAITDSPISSGE